MAIPTDEIVWRVYWDTSAPDKDVMVVSDGVRDVFQLTPLTPGWTPPEVEALLNSASVVIRSGADD